MKEECGRAFGGCGNYHQNYVDGGNADSRCQPENRRPSSGAEEVMERVYDHHPSPDEILALQDELGNIATLQARNEIWILKQPPEIVRRWKPSSMRTQT